MPKKEKKDGIYREFKLPKRSQPVFKFFSRIIFKPLYGVRCESMIEDLPNKAIIVSIHAAKRGPMSIAVSYPRFSAMWGHHGMLGSYLDRFKYLRNVLYVQKMHKNKLVATLKALYEALFSIYVYKGMKVIGTYTDVRFLHTVRTSMEVLDNDAGVIIFPEDSAEGYFDEMRAAFPGFVMLAASYYRERGEDVPVIPMYVSNKKKRLIVGEPRYVREMELSGLKSDEIAETLRRDINALYREYVITDKSVVATLKSAPVRNKDYYNEEEKA